MFAKSSVMVHGLLRMRVALAGLAVAASVWLSIASAHHSFAGVYDSSRSVTLDGVVTEFLFVHPHPFLLIRVVPAGGPEESWRAEMDNRFELADIGVTGRTFRPGDAVHVRGIPGRKEPHILYLMKLERGSDGLIYEQVGTSPRIEWPRKK
jgi:hypothetical protein